MKRFRHPLTEFCAPAKPSCELWRTALGVGLVLTLCATLMVLMRLGVTVIVFGAPEGDAKQLLNGALRETAQPTSTLSFMLYLATFASAWPVLWLVMKLLHGRAPRTLWGPDGQLNWAHYRIGLAAALLVGALAWLPWLHLIDFGAISLRQLSSWLAVLAIGLPLLFVQTAAEELVFRGYMLQQLGARTWSILGWSVTPAVLFAMVHHGEGQPLGLNWLSLVFALVLAAITSRTANLGAAAGLHFGHNVVNTLIISSAATGHEPALFVISSDVETRGPLLIMIALVFLGSIIFMGRMDLKFIMAWRADPERKGRPPVRLVLPLNEQWVAARERREAARKARREARRPTV